MDTDFIITQENISEFKTVYEDRVRRAMINFQGPILGQDKALVISFDRNYRPYIPTVRGYNCEKHRLRIRDTRLTNCIGVYLKRHRMSLDEPRGGRVFINSEGVFIKNSISDSITRIITFADILKE